MNNQRSLLNNKNCDRNSLKYVAKFFEALIEQDAQRAQASFSSFVTISKQSKTDVVILQNEAEQIFRTQKLIADV